MIRVIKLGGSLLTLPDWHERFLRWLKKEPPAANLLLIGGGELVDVLRREQERFPYTQRQMHFAALAAMEINSQLALARLPQARLLPSPLELQRHLPPVIDRGLSDASTILIVGITGWWQAAAAAGQSLPPETWATTSDSIAAWLARAIAADELVLLKSAEPPTDQSGCTRVETWMSQGYVDSNFANSLGEFMNFRAVNLRASGDR